MSSSIYFDSIDNILYMSYYIIWPVFIIILSYIIIKWPMTIICSASYMQHEPFRSASIVQEI